MLRARIIPSLLIEKGYVIKTINFQSSRYIGEPINIVKIFNDKNADEILIYDVGCSKFDLDINFKLIENISMVTRMPFCYGGGVQNIDQASKIFSFGVEKISISSSVFKNLNLIKEISSEFGQQSIAVTLDINQDLNKNYFIADPANKLCHYNLIEFINNLQVSGLGELIINCIHRDGKMSGIDKILLRQIYDNTHIPLTIIGGISSLEEIKQISEEFPAVGIGVGSFFIYKGRKKAILISYPETLSIK